MARRSSSFQTRIAIIALLILAGFVVLFTLLSRLGTPTGPLPAETPATPSIVEGLGETPAATVEPATPAVEPPVAEPPAADMPTAGSEQITLQLFLIDRSTLRLTPRVIRIDAPLTLASRAEAALRELIVAGSSSYVSPLPPDTQLREVWFLGGIAYVDFADGFADLLGGGSMNEIHAVYGVIGTLTTSFPEIERVQFLVDGQPVETLNGHLDLSLPLGPLSDWLY